MDEAGQFLSDPLPPGCRLRDKEIFELRIVLVADPIFDTIILLRLLTAMFSQSFGKVPFTVYF